MTEFVLSTYNLHSFNLGRTTLDNLFFRSDIICVKSIYKSMKTEYVKNN